MNYQKLYTTIIKKHGISQKLKGVYLERHHIIPKCIGGSNNKENLIFLEARVHFIVHHLLCKIHPNNNKLKFAFWAMCNQKDSGNNRHYAVSSRIYETAKKEFSAANSLLHKYKKLSSSHINIIRERAIRNNPNKNGKLKNRPRLPETIAKIRQTISSKPKESNPSFTGYWLTPKGKFSSASDAAKIFNSSSDTIRRYCRNSEIVVTSQMVTQLNNPNILDFKFVGMPLRELGWGFQPKPLQEIPVSE